MKEKCGNCAFANFHGVPDLECRRYAPKGNRGESWNCRADFPQVTPDMWCGDYKFVPEDETNVPSWAWES